MGFKPNNVSGNLKVVTPAGFRCHPNGCFPCSGCVPIHIHVRLSSFIPVRMHRGVHERTRVLVTHSVPDDSPMMAREKSGNQKAISPDMYFGRNAYDPSAVNEAQNRLRSFQGATSISSNQYFGREEEDEGGIGISGAEGGLWVKGVYRTSKLLRGIRYRRCCLIRTCRIWVRLFGRCFEGSKPTPLFRGYDHFTDLASHSSLISFRKCLNDER
jgi:hypothetical protein